VGDSHDAEGFFDPVVDRLLVEPEVQGAEGDVLSDGGGEDLVVRVLEDHPDGFLTSFTFPA